MSRPWVYRGQINSTWHLEPSISRAVPIGFGSGEIHQIEKDLRHKFESTALHYSTRADLPQSDFGWLALMQHHGAPTRLLDFTESPFTALFFAMDGVDPYDEKFSSIIAIDYRQLNQKSLELAGKSIMDFGWDYRRLQLNGDSFFTEIVYRYVSNQLWVLEPAIKSRRILQQMGTFLIKGDISIPTNKTIETIYEKIPMKEFIIPHSLLTEAFDLLFKCGISYYGIYPGLEGLGKDVNLTLLQSLRRALAKK